VVRVAVGDQDGADVADWAPQPGQQSGELRVVAGQAGVDHGDAGVVFHQVKVDHPVAEPAHAGATSARGADGSPRLLCR